MACVIWKVSQHAGVVTGSHEWKNAQSMFLSSRLLISLCKFLIMKLRSFRISVFKKNLLLVFAISLFMGGKVGWLPLPGPRGGEFSPPPWKTYFLIADFLDILKEISKAGLISELSRTLATYWHSHLVFWDWCHTQGAFPQPDPQVWAPYTWPAEYKEEVAETYTLYLSGTWMLGIGGTSMSSCKVTTDFISKDSTRPWGKPLDR